MLSFILGFVTGSAAGIVIVSLLSANGKDE